MKELNDIKCRAMDNYEVTLKALRIAAGDLCYIIKEEKSTTDIENKIRELENCIKDFRIANEINFIINCYRKMDDEN